MNRCHFVKCSVFTRFINISCEFNFVALVGVWFAFQCFFRLSITRRTALDLVRSRPWVSAPDRLVIRHQRTNATNCCVIVRGHQNYHQVLKIICLSIVMQVGPADALIFIGDASKWHFHTVWPVTNNSDQNFVLHCTTGVTAFHMFCQIGILVITERGYCFTFTLHHVCIWSYVATRNRHTDGLKFGVVIVVVVVFVIARFE